MVQIEGNVVSKKEGSALTVSLHPLVIMNISDHHTRVRAQSGVPKRVIGALVGVQSGRNVEICNSFELVFEEKNEKSEGVSVDIDYLKNKQAQFRTVFPKFDFLGWYSTGETAQASDIDIHKQFLPFNETPFFLLLTPHALFTSGSGGQEGKEKGRQELPITIFESELQIIQDTPRWNFTRTQFKIETGEAERIAVDHVAHSSPVGATDGSALTAHIVGLRNAINMLHQRIQLIEKYLCRVKSGELPKDHELLRRISGLRNMLPTIDNARFSEEYLNEYNDALLVTYMAAITKTTSSVNDLLEKHSVASDQYGLRQRYHS